MSISKETLNKKLKSIFGFNSFRAEQKEIIMNLLAGNDSMVIMPTGGGKSVVYQVNLIVYVVYFICCMFSIIYILYICYERSGDALTYKAEV